MLYFIKTKKNSGMVAKFLERKELLLQLFINI